MVRLQLRLSHHTRNVHQAARQLRGVIRLVGFLQAPCVAVRVEELFDGGLHARPNESPSRCDLFQGVEQVVMVDDLRGDNLRWELIMRMPSN